VAPFVEDDVSELAKHIPAEAFSSARTGRMAKVSKSRATSSIC
jgi:hypothetical protein